jgi:ABC-type transport system substrate-binding protein
MPPTRFARWPLAISCLAAFAFPCAHAADPNKVIRVALQGAEKNFDCGANSDEPSGTLCENIFEPLLQYDHLARPIKLQGRTAIALPEISPDGRTYTFKLKHGIFFTDDPAFKGKKRELTAQDYIYCFKRLLDPKTISNWKFLLDGKIVGLNELAEESKKTGRFDYDKPIRGLEASDPYTLIIRLKEPDYNLPYILTLTGTAAVAREVVEFYGSAFPEHPVGTGPYKLKDWRRASRVVLEANPDYREDYFSSAGSDDPRDQAIIDHLKGKRLPLVGRIEIVPIEEEQPRWLAFLNGEHDYVRPVPAQFIDVAMPGGQLAPNLAKRGMIMRPDEIAWLTYTTFNMNDPILGGYTPEKIALRRAISLAFPAEDEIRVVEKYQAIKAYSPIAEGMAGYVPERSPTLEYNPAKAKALLDMYGYIDRDGDGYREMPDGSPLIIDHANTPDQRAKSQNELWQRAMAAIGIRMTFNKVELRPALRDLAKRGKVQMFSYGWIADYPDGENFLQLFTTANIGAVNYTLFSLPEYDQLYERIKIMPDSPERTALYQRMVRLLWVYNPWRVNHLKRGTILIQPWLIGFKKHPFAHDAFRYFDIDTELLAKSRK